MKFFNKLSFLLFFSLISLNFINAQGGECKAGCPNYPCCLKTGDPCDDDKPCTTTGTGSTGGGTNYSGEDRPVVWIHGMEGSASSWQRYYNYYPQVYKIKKVVVQYSSVNGAIPAATSVNNQIISSIGANPQTSQPPFVIAHSMGGFVTRTMDMNGQGGFGGFVTCGTPNAGALLATNVANGNFDKFLKNGLAQVTKGPIAQGIPIPSLSGYFAGKVSDLLESKARASIEQFGAPGAMNTLSPTGGLVGTLNNVPPNSKPKMAFAGAETTPTLWREVESLINAPSTLNPDEESDALISNVVIKGFKDLYLAKHTLNKDLALGASILFRKKQYMNRANAWMDGHIWWDQSNGLWQVLIGAGGSATTKTVKMVDIIHHGFCDNEVVEKDRTYTVLSGTPNDGIVTEASALALPGADYTQTLTGVNHQQFMNHANVTTALTNKVFNGGGHAFFTCQPR